MTVAVLVLDLPVLAMNHQLTLLVLSDSPCAVHGVLLVVEHLGISLGAGPPDGPAIVARDDMLIALGHDEDLLHGNIAAK